MVQAIIKEKVFEYARAQTRAEKTVIVSAVVEVAGMHRKAVLRALARDYARSERERARIRGTALRRAPVVKQGRPPVYTAESGISKLTLLLEVFVGVIVLFNSPAPFQTRPLFNRDKYE